MPIDPPALDSLDPTARQRFETFARMLLERNRVFNLTAITDPEAVRVRHFEDALAALPLLRSLAPGLRLVDVGSGAGFPGIALGIAMPELRVTSIEATGKKARFQEEVVRALGLSHVRIINERSETIGRDVAHREHYDVATARAVGSIATVAELTLPLVRLGGRAILWRGVAADDEAESASPALAKLGGGDIREIPYDLFDPSENRGVCRCRLVIVEKVAHTPGGYPRRPGMAKKRPLA